MKDILNTSINAYVVDWYMLGRDIALHRPTTNIEIRFTTPTKRRYDIILLLVPL